MTPLFIFLVIIVYLFAGFVTLGFCYSLDKDTTSIGLVIVTVWPIVCIILFGIILFDLGHRAGKCVGSLFNRRND